MAYDTLRPSVSHLQYDPRGNYPVDSGPIRTPISGYRFHRVLRPVRVSHTTAPYPIRWRIGSIV